MEYSSWVCIFHFPFLKNLWGYYYKTYTPDSQAFSYFVYFIFPAESSSQLHHPTTAYRVPLLWQLISRCLPCMGTKYACGFTLTKLSLLLREQPPMCLSGKQSACQCRRQRFNHWVRKISWKVKWQLTPVFLPGESLGQRGQAGYSS